ncbi:MAG: hypothetical protein J5I93_15715 [Pirellulaceae bacterium]|nr:hypothetical protein [Pirellulaceae bacterium]
MALLLVAACLVRPVFAQAPDDGAVHAVVKLPWGELHRGADRLELHVTDPPADRQVLLPRLNNPLRQVYLRGDAARQPLGFKPGVDRWAIELPAKLDQQQPVIVVETVGEPRLAGVPRITSQAPEGPILLAAHDAVVHGKNLRYEPQPHKNTLGYWTEVDDWCQWEFDVRRPGEFRVVVSQGCGQGHGGSEVAVLVDKHELRFTVEDTGHFQNFRRREIGRVHLAEEGLHKLQIRPRTKARAAVMDVRQVELIPIRDEDR